ncbi:hypothetical protein ACJMK2_010458, partial [Sinanodonta woodiana]
KFSVHIAAVGVDCCQNSLAAMIKLALRLLIGFAGRIRMMTCLVRSVKPLQLTAFAAAKL